MSTTSQKLPVWLTIKTSYTFFFNNWKSFTRLALPWCILSTILFSFTEYIILFSPLFASTLEGELINSSFQIIRGILDIFIISPLLSVLFIGCVVLKRSFPKKIIYFSYGKKEWIYALYTILYTILFVVLAAMVGGGLFLLTPIIKQSFGWIIVLCAILGIGLIFLLGTRLRLVFQAIACGDNSTFLKNIIASWRAMKGSTLRLVVITFLGILPITPILLLNYVPLILSTILSSFLGDNSPFISSFFPGISIAFTFLGTLLYWSIFYGISNCISGQVYILKRQEMLSFLRNPSKK